MGVYPRSYPRSWPADSDRANSKPELFRSLGKVLNASQRSYCSGRRPAERDRALDLRCPTRRRRLTKTAQRASPSHRYPRGRTSVTGCGSWSLSRGTGKTLRTQPRQSPGLLSSGNHQPTTPYPPDAAPSVPQPGAGCKWGRVNPRASN